MGQSLEKDPLKCLSLIRSKCSYRGDLLIICTILAGPKTALNERKISKITQSGNCLNNN